MGQLSTENVWNILTKKIGSCITYVKVILLWENYVACHFPGCNADSLALFSESLTQNKYREWDKEFLYSITASRYSIWLKSIKARHRLLTSMFVKRPAIAAHILLIWQSHCKKNSLQALQYAFILLSSNFQILM